MAQPVIICSMLLILAFLICVAYFMEFDQIGMCLGVLGILFMYFDQFGHHLMKVVGLEWTQWNEMNEEINDMEDTNGSNGNLLVNEENAMNAANHPNQDNNVPEMMPVDERPALVKNVVLKDASTSTDDQFQTGPDVELERIQVVNSEGSTDNLNVANDENANKDTTSETSSEENNDVKPGTARIEISVDGTASASSNTSLEKHEDIRATDGNEVQLSDEPIPMEEKWNADIPRQRQPVVESIMETENKTNADVNLTNMIQIKNESQVRDGPQTPINHLRDQDSGSRRDNYKGGYHSGGWNQNQQHRTCNEQGGQQSGIMGVDRDHCDWRGSGSSEWNGNQQNVAYGHHQFYQGQDSVSRQVSVQYSNGVVNPNQGSTAFSHQQESQHVDMKPTKDLSSNAWNGNQQHFYPHYNHQDTALFRHRSGHHSGVFVNDHQQRQQDFVNGTDRGVPLQRGESSSNNGQASSTDQQRQNFENNGYERQELQNRPEVRNALLPALREQEAPIWHPSNVDVTQLFTVTAAGAEYRQTIGCHELEVFNSNGNEILENFEDFNLNPQLSQNIRSCGYVTPTPVQSLLMPLMRKKRDVMVKAETGAGKTAAVGVPIVQAIIENPPLMRNQAYRQRAPFAIILAHTIQLAQQLYESFSMYAYRTGVTLCVAYGGVGGLDSAISRGCDILIGTTVTVSNLIVKGRISLRFLQFFVIDEAGYQLKSREDKDWLRMIYESEQFKDASEYTTIFLSAVYYLPMEIREKINFIRDSRKREKGPCVEIRERGCSLQTRTLNKNIRVGFTETRTEEEKLKALGMLLKNQGATKLPKRTMIFIKDLSKMDFLVNYVSARTGYLALPFSKNLSQEERKINFSAFKKNYVRILITSDLLSRGIEIPDLEQVILYDVTSCEHQKPNLEEFLFKCGRVCRTCEGNVHFFMNPFDKADRAVARGISSLTDKQEKGKAAVQGILSVCNPSSTRPRFGPTPRGTVSEYDEPDPYGYR